MGFWEDLAFVQRVTMPVKLAEILILWKTMVLYYHLFIQAELDTGRFIGPFDELP